MTLIFISYSRQDEPLAKSLQAKLHGKRYDVWLDQSVIRGGMDWWAEIKNGIDSCDAFIVILSNTALDSEYIKKEVQHAIEANKRIVPILIQPLNKSMDELGIAHIQYLDFMNVDFTNSQNNHTKGLMNELAHDFGVPSTSRKLILPEKEAFVTGLYKWMGDSSRSEIIEKANIYISTYKLKETDLSNLLRTTGRLHLSVAWVIAIIYALTKLYPNFTKEDAIRLGKLAYLPDWALTKIHRLFKAKINWNQIRTPSSFEGRYEELQNLRNLLSNPQDISMILIDGFPGIGKTTLTINLIEYVSHQFDYIYLVDLYQITSIERVLKNILQFIDDSQQLHITDNVDDLIENLIDLFRSKNCLLIIDNFEILLNSDGSYRQGYEKYDSWLERLCYLQSASNVIITSRLVPVNYDGWRSSLGNYVQYISVKSLTLQSVQELTEQADITISIADSKWLREHTSGNPFVLILTLQRIHDYYNKSIEVYRKYRSEVGDLPVKLQEWIQSTISNLSNLQAEVLYFLMVRGEWTSQQDILETRYSVNATIPMLHQAILVLQQYKLIEENQEEHHDFRLIYIVYEYVLERFVNTITNEIISGKVDMLHHYPIMEALSKDYIRDIQERSIVSQINHKLVEEFQTATNVAEQLRKLVETLHNNSVLSTGCAAGNILNLLRNLEVAPIGWDFSRLTIRQAQLRNMELHNVDFSECEFYHCTFAQHFHAVLSIDLSHDGKLLAASMPQGCIVWELETFRQLWTHVSLSLGWINKIFFTGDDEYIIAVDMYSHVMVLNTYTGELVNQFRVSDERHRSSDYIKELNAILIGGDDPEIKLVDINNSHVLRAFNHKILSSKPNSIIYSLTCQNDFIYAGSSKGDIYCWNMMSDKHIFTISSGHLYPIWSIAVSSDNKYLASGDEGDKVNDILATIKIWDLQDNNRCIGTLTQHSNTVFDLKFSLDNKLLLSSSADTDICVWDVATVDIKYILKGHTRWIRNIKQHPLEQKLLYSGGDDRRIKTWDIIEGRPIFSLIGQSNRIRRIESLTPNIIAVATEYPHTYIWNMDTDKYHKVAVATIAWSRNFASSEAIDRIAYTDTNRIVITDFNGRYISTWPEHNIESVHADYIWGLAYNPNGTLLVSVGEDRAIVVWDVKTGIPIHRIIGHKNWIWEAKFTEDGKYLVTYDDHCINVWDTECILLGNDNESLYRTLDVKKGQWIKILTLIDNLPEIQFVSTGNGTECIIWNFEKDEITDRVTINDSPKVSSHIFAQSDDGIYIAFIAGDNDLYLWQKGQGLATFWKTLSTETTALTIVSDNRDYWLVSGDFEGIVEVWNIENNQLSHKLQPPKIYQDMNIQGIRGLTTAEINGLKILGARET